MLLIQTIVTSQLDAFYVIADGRMQVINLSISGRPDYIDLYEKLQQRGLRGLQEGLHYQVQDRQIAHGYNCTHVSMN